jgi:hypothetical protein
MRERWRSATDTAWNELSPASPERLGEAARGCSGLSLNGRNCVQNTRSATSATPHPQPQPHPHRHASHRDRPICGIHHYKYQSLNELTSENQIHSPLTSGRRPRTAPRPGPGPVPDSRLPIRAIGKGIGPPAPAGAPWERGACSQWLRRWSGFGVLRSRGRPASELRHAVSGDSPSSHGHGGHARRRARSRSHDSRHRATQLSVSQTRDTHTVHIQYTRHSSDQCSMCRMSNSARSPG